MKIASPCIPWTGYIGPKGYGVSKGTSAHRAVWEETFGPLPKHIVVDHLCRNRACVNVEHLEAVTQRVNILRGDLPRINKARSNKDTCRKGLHPWTPENTEINATSGRPQCRLCLAAAYRRAGERKRQRGKEGGRTQ